VNGGSNGVAIRGRVGAYVYDPEISKGWTRKPLPAKFGGGAELPQSSFWLSLSAKDARPALGLPGVEAGISLKTGCLLCGLHMSPSSQFPN